MSPVAAARTFGIRVPDSWYEFDVWKATHGAHLARLVDRRIEAEPGLTPHRGKILRLLRDLAEGADRQGAVLMAAMIEAFDGGGMLMASMSVFHTEGSPDPQQNTVDAIAAQITAVAPTDGSPVTRRVEMVDLAAGPAVRVTGVEQTAVDGHPLDAVVMQTLIPVPGGDAAVGERGVLNIVCSSPQLALAEEMLDLFDAISGTLAWAPELRPVPSEAPSEGK